MNSYRLYRQDVIEVLDNGDVVFDDNYIDGDVPSTSDEVTLVELDGSETRMVVLGFRLMMRKASDATT